MLPSSLLPHWQATEPQLASLAERMGWQWSDFFTGLNKEQQTALQTVIALSDYVADAFPRDHEHLCAAVTDGSINIQITPKTMNDWLDQLAHEASTEDEWHAALRKLRRRAMVHIIWRDALKTARTLETTKALSQLADLCVVRSIQFLSPLLESRHGQPVGKESGEQQHLLVIGMGKLGGWELNLSSDIDLIFAYPDSGNTTGPKVIR